MKIQLLYQNLERKQSFEIYYDKLLKNCPETFTKDLQNVCLVTAADKEIIDRKLTSGKRIIFRAPHICKQNINFVRYMMENCYAIVFQSDFTLQLYTSYFGKIEKQYIVLHNSVEKNEHECEHNNKILICGDFLQHQDRLPFETNKVASLLQTLEWLGKYYRITVAGSFDKNIDTTDRENVKFISGGTSFIDLSELRLQHGIYLHTVLFDNCPNSLLEAQAARMVCLGYRSGAVPELLSRPLCADYNKHSLLGKIGKAIKRSETWSDQADIAASGRNFAAYEYNLTRFIQGLW